MSDELTPEAELASALVDGDVGVTARAAALGVPVERVESLAAEYAILRAAIRDVPPAADERRESAIAAALAVFDEIAADGTRADNVNQPAIAPVTPLSPVSRPARPGAARWYRVTAAAASVALVGVIGTIAFGGLGGSDEDSASIATEAGELMPAAREGDSAVPGSPEAVTAATNEAFSAADTTVATESSESTAAADSAGGAVTSTIGTIGNTATAVPQVFGPDQLRLLAGQLRQQPAEFIVAAGCNLDAASILTDAFYNGQLVFVVDDPATGTVVAVDQATCAVVESVTP
jgi:hypothetical protein